MKKDWREFLLEYGGPKDIKFDIFFCKSSFYNDGVFVFKAREMQIQYSYKEDGEWYSGDETIYPELVIGDDRDNNFKTYIIINTPEHNEAELGDSWSNLGEMNFEETVKTLEEMNTLDYNLISEDEKEDFTYFSYSKIKSMNLEEVIKWVNKVGWDEISKWGKIDNRKMISKKSK